MNKEMKKCPGCIKDLTDTEFKARFTVLQMFSPDCPVIGCLREGNGRSIRTNTIKLPDTEHDEFHGIMGQSSGGGPTQIQLPLELEPKEPRR